MSIQPTPTYSTGQFWDLLSPKLSPEMRESFLDYQASYLTNSRVEVLFTLSSPFIPKEILEEALKDQLPQKIDKILESLENEFFEIHAPALTALILQRFFEAEAQSKSCTIQDLKISWSRAYCVMAACFVIACNYLEDVPLDLKDLASVFAIPVKSINSAIVEILNAVGNNMPTPEEVVQLSERLDEISDKLEREKEDGYSTSSDSPFGLKESDEPAEDPLNYKQYHA